MEANNCLYTSDGDKVFSNIEIPWGIKEDDIVEVRLRLLRNGRDVDCRPVFTRVDKAFANSTSAVMSVLSSIASVKRDNETRRRECNSLKQHLFRSALSIRGSRKIVLDVGTRTRQSLDILAPGTGISYLLIEPSEERCQMLRRRTNAPGIITDSKEIIASEGSIYARIVALKKLELHSLISWTKPPVIEHQNMHHVTAYYKYYLSHLSAYIHQLTYRGQYHQRHYHAQYQRHYHPKYQRHYYPKYQRHYHARIYLSVIRPLKAGTRTYAIANIEPSAISSDEDLMKFIRDEIAFISYIFSAHFVVAELYDVCSYWGLPMVECMYTYDGVEVGQSLVNALGVRMNGPAVSLTCALSEVLKTSLLFCHVFFYLRLSWLQILPRLWRLWASCLPLALYRRVSQQKLRVLGDIGILDQLEPTCPLWTKEPCALDDVSSESLYRSHHSRTLRKQDGYMARVTGRSPATYRRSHYSHSFPEVLICRFRYSKACSGQLVRLEKGRAYICCTKF
ncbi:hypothetical protein GMOD_00002527 [Pyrenophora seminiperda CCB06]|uniref:Uncharacterized protein n=1 Tax=Pyrenophora seminiperda CCB06 TaxID=1302712 RepID=A0A3M7M2H9_9PLEO|nr:hypothetical protein GMOD_00002527 [Pyrenophora seminiperda CCB06]